MGTCLRLTPVLLIALLGHNSPGGRMPGSPAGGPPVRTVACPDPTCSGKGRWQEGFIYRCRKCQHKFNYCRVDKRYLSDLEAPQHIYHLSG